MSGSSHLLWGLEHVPCINPLQKLLVIVLGNDMCADGICTLSARLLAQKCCSTEEEVLAQLRAWHLDGILAVAFSEARGVSGWIFPQSYAAVIAEQRERLRRERENRAAKKAQKLAQADSISGKSNGGSHGAD